MRAETKETLLRIKSSIADIILSMIPVMIGISLICLIAHLMRPEEGAIVYITSWFTSATVTLIFLYIILTVKTFWDLFFAGMLSPIVFCYWGYVVELETTGFGAARLWGIFNAKESAILFNYSTTLSFITPLYFYLKNNKKATDHFKMIICRFRMLQKLIRDKLALFMMKFFYFNPFGK